MIPQRFQTAIKALLLLATAFFLYGRIANGTLYYYINQRFAMFTLFAVIGLLAVGGSYLFARRRAAQETHHKHDHEHKHAHGLTWAGALVVALPVVLGLTVPPQPLGVAALDNRELNIGQAGGALPSAARAAAEKSSTDRNIMDWWHFFQANGEERAVGQEARVIGFVYKNPDYPEDHFFLTRFTVSCCVADASALALLVRAPDTHTLEEDQWIEVSGIFEPSPFEKWTRPVLVAGEIQPTEVPNQPYLFP